MCVECYLAAAGVGVFLGLLAAFVTKTRGLRDILIDMGVGVAGAILSAWFLAPLSSNQAGPHASRAAIAGALFGGVFFLALYKALRPHE